MKVELDQSEEARFQMTPMIDMVFLLLVFFMLASRMSTIQRLELEIPKAVHAVVPMDQSQRFTVNIRKDGSLFAGTEPMANMEELKSAVKAAREWMPETKVYLRADKDTDFVEVQRVMNAMSEIGVSDFIYGAFKPDR